MPLLAPISTPLCVFPHLEPNLDVSVPESGLIKLIPKLTFAPVFTDEGGIADLPVEATLFTTTFGFSLYKLATQVSTSVNVASLVLYFSNIVILSLFVLSLSFNCFTMSSASSNLDT